MASRPVGYPAGRAYFLEYGVARTIKTGSVSLVVARPAANKGVVFGVWRGTYHQDRLGILGDRPFSESASPAPRIGLVKDHDERA